MAAGLDSYDNDTKQTWRNTIWNLVAAKRPRYSLRDSSVVYLCGPDDLDRKCGLARGFKNQNLIAVDRIPQRIGEVRRAGGKGVCGKLQDLCAVWNGNQLDAIIADFQCGLTVQSLSLAASLMIGGALRQGGTLVVNLLRGRESGYARETAATWAEIRERCDGEELVHGFLQWGDRKHLGDLSKHRGVAWINIAMASVCKPLSQHLGYDFPHVFDWLMLECHPIVGSYKSPGSNGKNTQVFDWVAFAWPFGPLGIRTAEKVSEWEQVRSMMRETGRFDYQSHTARLAALTASRRKSA